MRFTAFFGQFRRHFANGRRVLQASRAGALAPDFAPSASLRSPLSPGQKEPPRGRGRRIGGSRMTRWAYGVCVLALVASAALADTPSPVTLTALRGLAPATALANTEAGRAALAANFSVTGGVQTGEIRQPTLMPFAQQQQQALRDAFIAFHNLTNLADGLGTTLGAAYQARAHYLDRTRFTSVSGPVADAINYAESVALSDAGAGKFFFANGTLDGKTPAPTEAQAILQDVKGAPDPFGRAYNRPAGSPGADRYGNSRPFQTEPIQSPIVGPDYFNMPASNSVYNRGPVMNLVDSPSYPSGHSTYGFTGAILLAVLVPERYSQMIARGAEYGNDRIILGAHYAMDVMSGRTLATWEMAHLLANDPAFMNRPIRAGAPLGDFRATLAVARADLTAALEAGCGDKFAACARQDIGRFGDAAAVGSFYAATQTYGLPAVHPEMADTQEDVGALAPEAGNLLTSAFPKLSLDEADRILTETEGPGAGFLDDGSAFGVYSRLNLYEAGRRAAALSHDKP